MRDINRIPKFTNKLTEFWIKNPDLRFGQIVEILKHELKIDDLFYVEEDRVMRVLEKLI